MGMKTFFLLLLSDPKCGVKDPFELSTPSLLLLFSIDSARLFLFSFSHWLRLQHPARQLPFRAAKWRHTPFRAARRRRRCLHRDVDLDDQAVIRGDAQSVAEGADVAPQTEGGGDGAGGGGGGEAALDHP